MWTSRGCAWEWLPACWETMVQDLVATVSLLVDHTEFDVQNIPLSQQGVQAAVIIRFSDPGLEAQDPGITWGSLECEGRKPQKSVDTGHLIALEKACPAIHQLDGKYHHICKSPSCDREHE
ncbi:uncharacterized protein LOC144302929 isoform X2 [Canis aureus]